MVHVVTAGVFFFVLVVKPTLSELSPAVQEVVKAGLTELTSDKDVEEISRSLLKAHSSSLIYRNACKYATAGRHLTVM